MSESPRYSEAECMTIFDRLFPQGFGGDDVLREIAPDNWECSPLMAVFHPSVDQVYEESRQMHVNLQSLRRRDDERPVAPPPTREEIVRDFRPSPVETEREVRELVGMCLWDVFSDNHEVVDADERLVDLGSFRATGGFLADYLNAQVGCDQYDYISFYLGTIWISQRADLTPVYQMIFRRLQASGLDWIYQFPRLHLIDLRPWHDSLKQNAGPDWAGYDPSQAFAEEQVEQQREQQLEEMRASLDDAHREDIEQARQLPPPDFVVAYQSVYGRFPQGWPPDFVT